MRGFSGIRLGKTAILPILALTLASTLAACGGASTANGSGTTGTSANSGGCKNLSSIGLAGTDNVAGHIRYIFAFTNEGSSSCTLEGYPTITVDNSAITVTTTTSTVTWSNVAIEPVTLAPNDVAFFGIQGYDQTTNCELVNPTIALPQETKGTPSDASIYICGGKLYVSPLVSSHEAFD